MQEYGRKEVEIVSLNKSLEVLNDKILQFQEYKKAKKQYEQLSEKEKELVDQNVKKTLKEVRSAQ